MQMKFAIYLESTTIYKLKYSISPLTCNLMFNLLYWHCISLLYRVYIVASFIRFLNNRKPEWSMLFTHDSSKGKHHMFLSLYLHYKKREGGEAQSSIICNIRCLPLWLQLLYSSYPKVSYKVIWEMGRRLLGFLLFLLLRKSSNRIIG